jgi:hypothetical protein
VSRILSVLNFLSVLLVLIVNYFSQTQGFNGTTISEVSNKYSNLFTPAGYAFSIWGLIFFSLLAYASFQVYQSFKKEEETLFIKATGPWFLLANVANVSWVIAWSYDYTLYSVLLMFIILLSLLKIVINTNMEKWDAPLNVIAFTWWPICLYSGWITVASIANVAAYLTKIGWNGSIFNESQWTMIMIALAGAINILIIYKRNMREFAVVGIWALVAIYVRHMEEYQLLSYWALAVAVIILINVSYHAYINRKSNPMYKMVNGGKP